jgi:hypothetical protein
MTTPTALNVGDVVTVKENYLPKQNRYGLLSVLLAGHEYRVKYDYDKHIVVSAIGGACATLTREEAINVLVPVSDFRAKIKKPDEIIIRLNNKGEVSFVCSNEDDSDEGLVIPAYQAIDWLREGTRFILSLSNKGEKDPNERYESVSGITLTGA